MKLKTLVGSMVALGLVSTAAHALPRKPQNVDTKVNNLTKRVNALESVINRNQDNADNNPKSLLSNDWYKDLTISGELEPVLSWDNRTMNYAGGRRGEHGLSNAMVRNEQTTSVSMNTMELYLDGQVNNFTTIHAALDYDYNWDKFATINTDPVTLLASGVTAPNKELFFSEANVRFSNLAKSGAYTVIGKQFFNFGSYQHDSINAPMTELFAKNNNVGITAGFISTTGFNVDAFLENGLLDKRSDFERVGDDPALPSFTHSARLRTWGLNAGYAMKNRNFGINAQLSFISNLAQNYYFAHSIYARSVNFDATPEQNQTYYQNTPGLAGHLDLSSGPFDLIFDYVGALRSFASTDLATEFSAGSEVKGARPEATFTQLAYNFRLFQHASTAYVAYQTTKNAQAMYDSVLGGFLMPKTRTTVGYEYMLVSNTKLNLEYDHDQDYKRNVTGDIPDTNTGSGRTSDGVALGIDVKF